MLARLGDIWRKNAPELIAYYNGGLPDFITARRPRAGLAGVPIFCYHVVETPRLRADLQYLARNGYRTLSAAGFVDVLEGKVPHDGRSVLLTFDDGPRNFYDVAFPLLREFQAHALAFIAPGLHAEAAAGDAQQQQRPMNWTELREIHASGLVSFQSHTLESRFLPRWPMIAPLAGVLPSIEAQRRGAPLDLESDLRRARAMLEEKLPGHVADQLSFPMYIGTEDAVRIAKSCGIRACYWGHIPGRALNRPGDSTFHVSRVSDEFLQRLPGDGRAGWRDMVRERLHRSRVARDWRRQYATS